MRIILLLQIRDLLGKHDIFIEWIRGREDFLTKHLESRRILVYGDLKIPMPIWASHVLFPTIRFQVKGLSS